ncbi:uncharacterized protein LOC62_04G006576 [Vanrija pseudolonga]|uniref:Uncharacterized protein n=1 Tax=Vanrija pseudolonga TaxID=143232 RepID=A0AAF0YAM0_9TREE|nr:hypothetical protein LOC62_04G006576 [Vanrija pseudolonga]
MQWLYDLYTWLTDTSAREAHEADLFAQAKDMILTFAACQAEDLQSMADARVRAIVTRTLALADYPVPVDRAERTKVMGWLGEFFTLLEVPGHNRRTLGAIVRSYYDLPADGPNRAPPATQFDVDTLAPRAEALVDAVLYLESTGVLAHAALFPPHSPVDPASHEQVKADVVAELRLRRVQWEGEMAARAAKRGAPLSDEERRAELREFLRNAAAERARGEGSLARYRAERAALA